MARLGAGAESIFRRDGKAFPGNDNRAIRRGRGNHTGMNNPRGGQSGTEVSIHTRKGGHVG